jgi:L-lactate dehydrogenase complex protein LldG
LEKAEEKVVFRFAATAQRSASPIPEKRVAARRRRNEKRVGSIMSDRATETVLERVRRSLRRTETPKSVPPPPAIDEPIARLVHSDIGLGDLFVQRASAMKMLAETIHVGALLEEMATFLRERQCARVMLSDTPLLTKLGVVDFLKSRGFDARRWSEITPDEAYDFDAGVTDVDYAVAESGSLVIRHRPEHGRLISLVPFVHVAVVEPRTLLPDLIDLFNRLAVEGVGGGVTMISGPSKTADIEMNVVTGVHGPNVVKAYVLH